MNEGEEATVSEISVRCPAAGYLFISASMESQGNASFDFALYDVTGAPVKLFETSARVYQDTLSIGWVREVTGPGYVNLKTTCAVSDDGTPVGTRAFVWTRNLTAIYVPVRYQ